jgi:signal transduction histidine kinase
VKLRISLLLSLVTLCTFGAVLPLLYVDLAGVVTRSHAARFVEDARTFTRFLAQQLEVGPMIESPRLVSNLLDTAILNGDGVYAELRGPGFGMRSELNAAGVEFPGREDLHFDEGGDSTYFIQAAVEHGGKAYQLRLGFDERATLDTIAGARRHILWSMAAYLAVSLAAGLGLGYLLTRPLRRLQRLARQVVQDPNSQSLQLDTPIEEVSELAADLQRMREGLVAASRRLQHRERLETVGTLAGGMAHEFNNALVPILLLSELALREKSLPERTRADLQTVLAAGRQARTLVRQILTFSRELGETQLETVDLSEVVQATLRMFRPTVASNVEVATSLQPGCPPVLADRTLAQQLLLNLCTNAHQALRGRGGRIVIALDRARDQAGEGERIELAVHDTGEGIDEATLAHIFEPFYTTRGVGEGTGLGLSVVHGIARGFNATVQVESRPGIGSIFRVLFPPAPPPGRADGQ